MPTRRLPAQPDLAHLKHQAKDLLNAHRAHDVQAIQRLREFHPRLRQNSDTEIAAMRLSLSDAQLAIAREHGFPSWPRLKAFVNRGNFAELDLPAHERIGNSAFRHAVDLLDEGDAKALDAHLRQYPDVVHERVTLPGGNYFQHPTLIEFIAENPARRKTLPLNAAQIARIILDAGAKDDAEAMNSALDLVASSDVARQAGVKDALIDVLCEYGADPNTAMLSASLYGEFDGVRRLLERGATVTLPIAAALGRDADVRRLLPRANERETRLALALAAQHQHVTVVRMLLEAGVAANGYTPVGGHSHATPLHQAALNGNREIAEVLIRAGARTDVRDILYGGTPADWAEHAHFTQLASWLRAQ